MVQSAYNLCDIDMVFYRDPGSVRETLRTLISRGTERVYAGSYFCANYFMEWAGRSDGFMSVIREEDIPLTVILPVFSNRTLAPAKEFLLNNRDVVQEVTVNDYGMLLWCRDNLSCPVFLGRLFMRQPRDPRYPDLQESRFSLPFSASSLAAFQREFRVAGLEMEGFGKEIDVSDMPEGMTFCLHRPWFMMSCDFICEDASSGLPLERKFRADMPCSLQCSGVHYQYTLMNSQVVKSGRGIYAWQESDPLCRLPQNSDLRYLEYYPYAEEGGEK